MIPTQQDVHNATGPTFWMVNIALWVILLSTAVTTGLCLAIWKMLEAF